MQKKANMAHVAPDLISPSPRHLKVVLRGAGWPWQKRERRHLAEAVVGQFRVVAPQQVGLPRLNEIERDVNVEVMEKLPPSFFVD